VSLTAARNHLRELLSDIPGDVKVYAGPSDYAQAEQAFIVRVLVGEPSEDNEAALDDLLAADSPDSVKAALETDRSVGVLKHSGYRLYPAPEGKQLLGAEWTVNHIF
jgi:hypothetical protein